MATMALLEKYYCENVIIAPKAHFGQLPSLKGETFFKSVQTICMPL